jgi:hypothetical protein
MVLTTQSLHLGISDKPAKNITLAHTKYLAPMRCAGKRQLPPRDDAVWEPVLLLTMIDVIADHRRRRYWDNLSAYEPELGYL